MCRPPSPSLNAGQIVKNFVQQSALLPIVVFSKAIPASRYRLACVCVCHIVCVCVCVQLKKHSSVPFITKANQSPLFNSIYS